MDADISVEINRLHDEVEKLKAENVIWKNNHADVVRRKKVSQGWNAKLKAKIKRLREALEPFANETAFTILTSDSCSVDGKALEQARKALKGGE